jgi:hypothetical protein
MEYLKEHKNIIKKEANSIKKFIIAFLQNENEKGRNTDKAISDLASFFYKEYLSNSLIEKHKFYFDKIINDLRIHRYNYDPNKVDSILKTLENEVHKSFMEIKETFSKYKLEDYEVLEDLNYENYFSEILKYTLYQKVQARLENSIPQLTEAIKLFYELNDYNDFSTTFLIDEREKITVLKINNIFKKHGRKLVSLQSKANQNIHNEKQNLNDIKKIISAFTEDEKIILLHLSLDFKNSIPQTERVKLFLLNSGIDDHTIFTEKSDYNTFYKRVNQGFKYRFSEKTKKNIATNILLLIENLDLPFTKEILTSQSKKQ